MPYLLLFCECNALGDTFNQVDGLYTLHFLFLIYFNENVIYFPRFPGLFACDISSKLIYIYTVMYTYDAPYDVTNMKGNSFCGRKSIWQENIFTVRS